jgi:hypothetical protein
MVGLRFETRRLCSAPLCEERNTGCGITLVYLFTRAHQPFLRGAAGGSSSCTIPAALFKFEAFFRKALAFGDI